MLPLIRGEVRQKELRREGKEREEERGKRREGRGEREEGKRREGKERGKVGGRKALIHYASLTLRISGFQKNYTVGTNIQTCGNNRQLMRTFIRLLVEPELYTKFGGII